MKEFLQSDHLFRLGLLHFGEVDAVGHKHGSQSKQYRNAVKRVSTHLRNLFQTAINETQKNNSRHNEVIWIITSDHGHLSSPGGHGGAEEEVRRVPLLIATSKNTTFPPKCQQAVHNIKGLSVTSVATLASFLVNVPSPRQAVYVFPIDVLSICFPTRNFSHNQQDVQLIQKEWKTTAQGWRLSLGFNNAREMLKNFAELQKLRHVGMAVIGWGGTAVVLILNTVFGTAKINPSFLLFEAGYLILFFSLCVGIYALVFQVGFGFHGAAWSASHLHHPKLILPFLLTVWVPALVISLGINRIRFAPLLFKQQQKTWIHML
jgi:hypothetical protein